MKKIKYILAIAFSLTTLSTSAMTAESSDYAKELCLRSFEAQKLVQRINTSDLSADQVVKDLLIANMTGALVSLYENNLEKAKKSYDHSLNRAYEPNNKLMTLGIAINSEFTAALFAKKTKNRFAKLAIELAAFAAAAKASLLEENLTAEANELNQKIPGLCRL